MWTNEVWGLAALNNEDDRYLTCSDDATMRLWSSVKRKMITMKRFSLERSKKKKYEFAFEDPSSKQEHSKKKVKGSGGKKGKAKKYDLVAARCVGINMTDTIIAVGMKLGCIMVISADPTVRDLAMQKIKVITQSKRWISEIKFSPTGKQMAVGAHDQRIYMYNTTGPKKFRKVKPMLKHSSAITHIDWSEDGQNIQSNCQAYEILFWDAQSKLQMPSGASALKNTKWLSWTSTIGFRVQEIWRGTEDGTDVNAVDRSHGKVKDQGDDSYHLMARADDFGKVSLYKDPIVIKG